MIFNIASKHSQNSNWNNANTQSSIIIDVLRYNSDVEHYILIIYKSTQSSKDEYIRDPPHTYISNTVGTASLVYVTYWKLKQYNMGTAHLLFK